MLLLLPFLVMAAVVAKLFAKPVIRTPSAVADILLRRISAVPDWHEWDDFICVPIQEKMLEQIRNECRAMVPEDQAPPVYISDADRIRIQQFIEELRRG